MKSIFKNGSSNGSVKKGQELFGSVQNADFKEGDHPRAADGKFGSGGGGSEGGSGGSGGGSKTKGDSNVVPIKKPLKKDDWFKTVKDTQPYMWDRKGPGELTMLFTDKKAGKLAGEKMKSLGGKPSALKYDDISGKYHMTVKEPEFTGESEDEQQRIKKEKADHRATQKRESGPDQKDFDRMDRKNDPDKRSKASEKKSAATKAPGENKTIDKFISLVAEFDKKQSAKPSFNIHASKHYDDAIKEAVTKIKSHDDPKEAIKVLKQHFEEDFPPLKKLIKEYSK